MTRLSRRQLRALPGFGVGRNAPSTLDERLAAFAAGDKPARAIVERPEEGLQREVVLHLEARAPKDLLWFAVPNQRGTRKRWEQALLKAMGLKAGVADLVFVLPGGRVGFVELKAPENGRQSQAQKDFEADALALGALYLVCRTLAEVEGALAAWGVPLNGRVSA